MNITHLVHKGSVCSAVGEVNIFPRLMKAIFDQSNSFWQNGLPGGTYKGGTTFSRPYLIGQHPFSPVSVQKRSGRPDFLYTLCNGQLPPGIGNIMFPSGGLLEKTRSHVPPVHSFCSRLLLGVILILSFKPFARLFKEKSERT